jgi:hypothetical protein
MSTEANLRICDLQLEIAALQRQLFESFDEIYKLKTSNDESERIESLERELEDMHTELRESTLAHREEAIDLKETIMELRSENMIMAEHIDNLENQ